MTGTKLFREINAIDGSQDGESGFDKEIVITNSSRMTRVIYSTSTRICRVYFVQKKSQTSQPYYNYYNVSPELFEGFATTESSGEWLQKQFIGSGLECERVE